jgi:outer membrane protein TolC
VAKQIDNTAANIKLLKNQTKQLREQIVVLEKLKKLEDGITEAQESQLENYVKQLKAKRSELKASKKHVNSSKD